MLLSMHLLALTLDCQFIAYDQQEFSPGLIGILQGIKPVESKLLSIQLLRSRWLSIHQV